MMTLPRKPALVIIDAQQGILEEDHWGGNRNNRQAEVNIARLLAHWRKKKFPVVIVQHCSVSPDSPLKPSHPGNKLMEFLTLLPDERLIQKSTTSAWIKPDLLTHLEKEGISSLVLTGFVTNNSVEATARTAGDLGFHTIVVSDATACFDKLTINGTKFAADVVHELSLSNLSGEYADICTTEEILRHNP